MSKRDYTHVQELYVEIQAKIESGCTQREVAEHFGFKDKRVVHNLLNRERRNKEKLDAGITPRPKGRPRKDAAPRNVFAEHQKRLLRLCEALGHAGKGCASCGRDCSNSKEMQEYIWVSQDADQFGEQGNP